MLARLSNAKARGDSSELDKLEVVRAQGEQSSIPTSVSTGCVESPDVAI